MGKSGIGYLMKRSDSRRDRRQLASATVCPGVADGGDAVVGSVVYVPCATGVTAGDGVGLSPRTEGRMDYVLSVFGCADHRKRLSVVDRSQRHAVGGSTCQTATLSSTSSLGSEATHFPTPTVADGLLIAPAAQQVFAFAGPQGVPTSP